MYDSDKDSDNKIFSKKKLDKIHATAMERFRHAQEAWTPEYNLAKDDLKFLLGGDNQWPSESLNARKKKNKPVLTVNKLPIFIKRVVGDMRQNKISIKVRPTDDTATAKIAEVAEGHIRNIEYSSQGADVYITAGESAVKCGFGFLRILTKYSHARSFEQEIVLEPIVSVFQVLLDPKIKRLDGSDGRFAFISSYIDKKDFEKEYPDKECGTGGLGDDESGGWVDENSVRVTEYYWIEKEKKELIQFSTGETVFADEIDDAEIGKYFLAGIEVVGRRKTEVPTVYWAKITADGFVEEPKKVPGEYIPVVPVFGDTMFVEGRWRMAGLIRYAKEPQQMYNFFKTAIAEQLAMQPKAPFIASIGQIEGLPEWKTPNGDHSVLRYKPDDKAFGRPAREQPPTGSSALINQALMAGDEIKDTIGIHDSSLGAQSNETSGVAIARRQDQANRSNFTIFDNLESAVEQAGRIIVSMLPEVMVEPNRRIRIMGEDKATEMVSINDKREEEIIDFGRGRYDVAVTTGAGYATTRMESADKLMQLIQAVPQLGELAADIAVENMDIKGADVLVERLRRMNPALVANKPSDTTDPESIDASAQGAPTVPPDAMQVLDPAGVAGGY